MNVQVEKYFYAKKKILFHFYASQDFTALKADNEINTKQAGRLRK